MGSITPRRSGNGVVQIEDSFMPASRAFWDEYRKKSKEFLDAHATGMCHDLIRSSLPLATAGAAMAWSFDKVNKNHQRTVLTAFRPIRSRTLGQYLLNQDWASCEAYGFKSTSAYINNLISQKKWPDVLQAFQRHGGITPDGLGKQRVEDSADLQMLYEWKKNRKPKGGKKAPIYIRKPRSIQTLVNNNSTATRVGLMAGGWMLAARKLGNKPDPSTQKVTGAIWLQNKGRGGANRAESGNECSVMINNEYANIGGWMKNPAPQRAINYRHLKMNSLFPLLFMEAAIASGFDTRNNA